MLTKLFPQAPPAPCVLVVLLFLGVLLSREASTKEALPVFLSDQQDFFAVELIGDDIEPGVYQFNDGLTLLDVIKLTDPGRVNSFEVESYDTYSGVDFNDFDNDDGSSYLVSALTGNRYC